MYLPSLRDVSRALRLGRNSLLARTLHLLTDDAALQELDEPLEQHKPIVNMETTNVVL